MEILKPLTTLNDGIAKAFSGGKKPNTPKEAGPVSAPPATSQFAPLEEGQQKFQLKLRGAAAGKEGNATRKEDLDPGDMLFIGNDGVQVMKLSDMSTADMQKSRTMDMSDTSTSPTENVGRRFVDNAPFFMSNDSEVDNAVSSNNRTMRQPNPLPSPIETGRTMQLPVAMESPRSAKYSYRPANLNTGSRVRKQVLL